MAELLAWPTTETRAVAMDLRLGSHGVAGDPLLRREIAVARRHRRRRRRLVVFSGAEGDLFASVNVHLQPGTTRPPRLARLPEPSTRSPGPAAPTSTLHELRGPPMVGDRRRGDAPRGDAGDQLIVINAPHNPTGHAARIVATFGRWRARRRAPAPISSSTRSIGTSYFDQADRLPAGADVPPCGLARGDVQAVRDRRAFGSGGWRRMTTRCSTRRPVQGLHDDLCLGAGGDSWP